MRIVCLEWPKSLGHHRFSFNQTSSNCIVSLYWSINFTFFFPLWMQASHELARGEWHFPRSFGWDIDWIWGIFGCFLDLIGKRLHQKHFLGWQAYKSHRKRQMLSESIANAADVFCDAIVSCWCISFLSCFFFFCTLCIFVVPFLWRR